jgi:DNA-binding response OmpR family regulator
MPRVLIVEDDDAMRDMVGYALADEGMEVEAVADGESALDVFSSSGPFDLVILDVMLPGIDGVTVCKELTSVSDVPVIMLTARDDEMSVVVGLEVGADDYITKPFSHRELVSRVRATLRRRRIDARASSKQESLEFPGLAIDLARRQVVAQGTPVDLTAAQFDILRLLASHPGWDRSWRPCGAPSSRGTPARRTCRSATYGRR